MFIAFKNIPILNLRIYYRMTKTKLVKIIVTCLIYGLASALTQNIWR